MAEPWTPDELEWAHECAAAGDTFAEIAKSLGRAVEEIRPALKVRRALTSEEAEVASLLAAGTEHRVIGEMVGRSHAFPWVIRNRLAKLGYRVLQRRRQKASPLSLSIAEQLLAGLPQHAVVKSLGVSRGQVAGVACRMRAEGAAVHG